MSLLHNYWYLTALVRKRVSFGKLLWLHAEGRRLRQKKHLTAIERLFMSRMPKQFDLLCARYVAWVPFQCDLSETVCYPHEFNGIHIAPGAHIGRDCVIFQHVTIGAYRDQAPIVGNGVVIGASASIVGRCTIGDGAKIGVGVVIVDRDIPAGATIVNMSAYNRTEGAFIYPQG